MSYTVDRFFAEADFEEIDTRLRSALAEKWQHAALRTKLKELEYSLKMQRKRIALLMQEAQLQAQPA